MKNDSAYKDQVGLLLNHDKAVPENPRLNPIRPPPFVVNKKQSTKQTSTLTPKFMKNIAATS